LFSEGQWSKIFKLLNADPLKWQQDYKAHSGTDCCCLGIFPI
jgi:hypothetical protein